MLGIRAQHWVSGQELMVGWAWGDFLASLKLCFLTNIDPPRDGQVDGCILRRRLAHSRQLLGTETM